MKIRKIEIPKEAIKNTEEKKVVITDKGINYDDIETLERLLPTMCISVAYVCKLTGKNVMDAVATIMYMYEKTEVAEDFIQQSNNDD